MEKHNKKVKYIAYSDVHLAMWKQFNEGLRRTKNGIDVIKRIKGIAKVLKADVLFLGDLFDKEKMITNPLMHETFPQLKKYLDSKVITTYAISGNHDQSESNTFDNHSPNYINTLSKIFKGLKCLDYKVQKFDDHALYGIPYITHDLGMVEYIENLKIDNSKVNILMLHTTMPNVRDTDGRKMDSFMDTNDFEKAIGRFDIVLSGHIHKPMSFKIGKTQVVQIGAPQQQRFTDRNCDMGYWVIYEDFEVKFIPFTNYPKFVEVEPGQEKPKGKDFYVIAKKKKEDKEVDAEKENFDINLNGRKLAINYCKEKGIKDKKKKIALKNVLKNLT
ncbi:MAG: hypothetical protein CL596_05010 [Alteromonas sp.]|nr:hypothetical protein [Alteromonas sp.]|tara:strand:- start:3695 stop:4687 length:993 start_codon:yes stop_codon:yes gene_type:complete